MHSSKRLFFEIVNVFNALDDLRTKQVSSDVSPAELRLATCQALLHPSRFNAAILTKFGKVTIVWVDSIVAHLDFDVGTKDCPCCDCRLSSESSHLMGLFFNSQ